MFWMNLRFVLVAVARTGWGCEGGLAGDGGFGASSAPSLAMELSTSGRGRARGRRRREEE